MKYSILVPTRRPHHIDRFLRSVADYTQKPQNIEVLLAIDEDDLASQHQVSDLQNRYKTYFPIIVHYRKHSQFINEDYYNWLARRASGDMFWCLGDDTVLQKAFWDVYVEERLTEFFEKYPDRIVCVSIKDNTPPPSNRLPKFPCFPMLSKEVLNLLGYILYPQVPTWGADYVAYCTYEPIGRLLEIHDHPFVNHISYHTRQTDEDPVALNVGNTFNQLKGRPEHNTDRIIAEEIPKVRIQLLEYINEYNRRVENVK